MCETSRLLVAIVVSVVVAGCGQAPPETPEPSAAATGSVAESADVTLAGTEWLVTDIDGEAVGPDVQFTVVFDAADRVSGTAGCNRYFGAYSTDGDAIAFGHLGATQMMCPPELMEQEQRFLDLLAHTERFERRLGTLVLATGGTARTMALTMVEPSPLVSGTVLYRERIALPPAATLTVRLAATEAGTPVLGEAVVHPTGQVPIPFEIAYDPARIAPGNSYFVRAGIDVGGQPMFASLRPVPVITGGHPSRDVEILVDRVEPPPATPAGF